MTDAPPAPLPQALPSEAGYRWLAIAAVEPGMSVARPVSGNAGGLETMYVAAGARITADTIAQMLVKGVECVAVFDDPAQPAGRAVETGADGADFERRLAEIFGAEPNPACGALRDALRAARRLL